MISVSGQEGLGRRCTPPPSLLWGGLFGVVLSVLLWFGGFFWFVLGLGCYCLATE
jgi:hypothetical protein